MNLKLKRLVRTSNSEQYALFDLNQIEPQGGTSHRDSPSENGADQQPMTVGKFDLHYTSEGVYGTLLLWDENFRTMEQTLRQEFIYALLNEVVQPMGVPNEYVIEFFAPDLQGYEVFHNVGLDDFDTGEKESGELSTTQQSVEPVYESPNSSSEAEN